MKPEAETGSPFPRCKRICKESHVHQPFVKFFATIQDGVDWFEANGKDSKYAIESSDTREETAMESRRIIWHCMKKCKYGE